ncbi:zinc finger protein 804A, partial [Hoplias malabaricus]|uniref:zinc finger protein 804A n=1 Tax=Hoplias malabaricus TaxID=27720 RepID=UPI00346348ED
APGSGPMFKSTTVAVEGSFRDPQEENQGSGGQDLGPQNQLSSCKQAAWTYGGKTAKKQTFRRKIAFSFSFPKKATVKLESSAAVFCEALDEGTVERSTRIQVPFVELDLSASPAAEKTRELQGNTLLLCRSNSRVDAAPDLCAFLVYSEDTSMSPITHLASNSETAVDSERPSESSAAERGKAESEQEMGEERREGESDPLVKTSTDAPPDNHPFQNQDKEREEDVDVAASKTLSPFCKPSQPFFSVLGRDGKTIFQWPSEMVSFTTTVPSLPFSCNPLHFDFRGSQMRKSPDPQQVGEPKPDEESASVNSQKSSSLERHTEEAWCGHGAETKVRKCHQYSVDGESGARPKVPSSCRHSKDWPHAGKREEDKLRARERRHYRSQHKKRHKRRHKRRRRRRKRREEEDEEEEDDRQEQSESDTEKCARSHRRAESREELDSQFRGATSQQAQPLEKSKQSAQNQAENNSGAPAERREEAGRINGSAGSSDEPWSCGEKVLGNCGGTAGEADITGHGWSCLNTPPSARRASDHCCLGLGDSDSAEREMEDLREGKMRKKRHGEDEPWSDQTQCFYCGSLSEENKGIDSCPEHARKRQRLSQNVSPPSAQIPPQPSHLVDERASAEMHVSEAEGRASEVNDLRAVCDSSNGPDQISCSIDDLESSALDCQIPTSISGAPGQTAADNSCCQLDSRPASPSQINAASGKGAHAQPAGDQDPAENLTGTNQLAQILSRTEPASGNGCEKCAAAAQVCLLDVREMVPRKAEKTCQDKSCQHSPQPLQPQRFHLMDDEALCPRSHFHGTPCFQAHADSLERQCLLQAHAHRQVLHQQVFPTKLKPVSLQVSSPILHPVHMPSNLPSGSITIRHTILQHHATFLPPQPPIFPQVLPVTRLPLGPEICPPATPAFVTPSQVSVVAPPTIHPTAVTFHAIPRPTAVFPPILHRPTAFAPVLPHHPAVIPLQPLF